MAARYPAEATALRALLPTGTTPTTLIDAAYLAMQNARNPTNAHAVVKAWSHYECRAADPTGDPAELARILADTSWLLPHFPARMPLSQNTTGS